MVSLQRHLDVAESGARPTDVIRPIRIILSLLDRVEIGRSYSSIMIVVCIDCEPVTYNHPITGSVVLEDILLSVFKLLRRFYPTHAERKLNNNRDMFTYKLAVTLNLDTQGTADQLIR